MKETITRFTTEGLIIKEQNTGESDKLVTVFTKQYGVIRAFVSGARTINSKKGSATSLLCYSALSIAKRKDTYKIYEAQPISMFFTAGTDIEKLTVSQYFCELALTFCPLETPNEEFLRVLLNSLHFVANNKYPLKQIKAITEFRIMALSGYMPDLVACSNCGKFEDNIMFFDVTNGKLICNECNINNVGVMLNKTVLSALRHIVFSDIAKLYNFTVPEDDLKLLGYITENYVKMQSDSNFTTLDFYNSLQ